MGIQSRRSFIAVTCVAVLATLSRMSHHWSFHAGQIVFVTKQLRAGAVNDLMRRVMAK